MGRSDAVQLLASEVLRGVFAYRGMSEWVFSKVRLGEQSSVEETMRTLAGSVSQGIQLQSGVIRRGGEKPRGRNAYRTWQYDTEAMLASRERTLCRAAGGGAPRE
jgi:hypothetical protein